MRAIGEIRCGVGIGGGRRCAAVILVAVTLLSWMASGLIEWAPHWDLPVGAIQFVGPGSAGVNAYMIWIITPHIALVPWMWTLLWAFVNGITGAAVYWALRCRPRPRRPKRATGFGMGALASGILGSVTCCSPLALPMYTLLGSGLGFFMAVWGHDISLVLAALAVSAALHQGVRFRSRNAPGRYAKDASHEQGEEEMHT